MDEQKSGEQGVVEQGFAGAPEVQRRREVPQERVNVVLPIIAGLAVMVVIVAPMVAFRSKTARWRMYTSSPLGMATHRVTVDIPPGWQIRERGTTEKWGVRILLAAPEEGSKQGETVGRYATDMQVTCATIPQGQTLEQYMNTQATSAAQGSFQMEPIDVGGMAGFLVTRQQVQKQRAVYVSPEGSGVLYMLQLGCAPDRFRALEAVFDRVIQSFRVGAAEG